MHNWINLLAWMSRYEFPLKTIYMVSGNETSITNSLEFHQISSWL